MAWTTLSGAGCGAICGFFILWIVCIQIRGHRSIWDVLLSAIIGVPLGAAVGSLVADRWATGEPSSVASVILRHAAAGAISGAILLTILCITRDRTGGIACFLPGGLIGAPVGAAIGALVGASRARRK
jgi:hypothetical protein